MKILYFSLDYTPHDHRFLSVLSQSGHEGLYVRLQRGKRQTEDRPIPPNVEIVQWAGGQKEFAWRDLPRLTLDFSRLLKRLQPDLVHAGPLQTAAFIAALAGAKPLLSMSWGFDLMRDAHKNRWMESITRYTLRRSAFFTSDAEVTRSLAVELGMNPHKTVVFPWGVDLAHFRPAPPQPAPPAAFTLFSNRSWEALYGVDVLAQAFVQVARQREDVGLLLLGGGSQASQIRQILLNGGALERVQMPGHIPNPQLPRFYQMADLYISASHTDGSSVSLMEALACGLPCLVSDIPANREWVREGENGWLFPDGDWQALAAKILHAVHHRADLPALGKAARQTAEQKADWAKNAQTLLQTYAQVMEDAK